MARGSVPASTWPAPRRLPGSYPGAAPDHHYLLLGDEVTALTVRGRAGGAGGAAGAGLPDVALDDGTPLDEALAAAGAAPLAERVPVLAYGANRSPHSLAMKLAHHGYAPPGDEVAVPVLAGTLPGFDVVVGGLSSQGFVYADLTPSPGTRVAVLLTLLDPGQAAAIHDSEGVGRGLYDCARVAGFEVAGDDGPALPALAYAGCQPVFVSPETGTPLAFSAIAASGRVFREDRQAGLMAHALRATGVAGTVAGLLGADPDDPLATAREVTRLLNGQWWSMHNTDDLPRGLATRVSSLVREALGRHGAERSTAALLAGAGAVIDAEAAYAAGPELRLAALIGGR